MVAVNSRGDAVAVWIREHSTMRPPSSSGRRQPAPPSYYDVQAASKPGGQPWQPAVTISSRSTAAGTAISPVVAIDDRGTAVALWSRREGRRFRVESATKPAGQSWSSARRISQPSVNSYVPKLGMTPSGSAVAIWEAHYRTSRRVVRIATKAPGRRWRRSRALSDDDGAARLPDIAMNRHGAMAVVWSQQTVPSNVFSPWTLRARVRTRKGAWRRTATLAQTARGTVSDIEIDGRGHALVAWQTAPRSDQSGARFRPAGFRSAETRNGRWLKPRRINPRSQDRRDLGEVEISVDDAGNATAVWQTGLCTGRGVFAASKRPGRSWSTATRLSSAEGCGEAFPTAGADGRTIVAWTELQFGVRLAERERGAPWRTSVVLDPAAAAASTGSLPGDEPSVAIAGRRAAVVWSADVPALANPDESLSVIKAALAEG